MGEISGTNIEKRFGKIGQAKNCNAFLDALKQYRANKSG